MCHKSLTILTATEFYGKFGKMIKSTSKKTQYVVQLYQEKHL